MTAIQLNDYMSIMERSEFQRIVDQFYQPLYRFALSLTRNEADARDLTQDLFVRWAEKGHQLKDPSKTKPWLFTTMHRLFLRNIKKSARRPTQPLHLIETHQLPNSAASHEKAATANGIIQTLEEMDDVYRVPLTLFYLRQHTYQEIADILDIPIGTVMSRLNRGRRSLREKCGVTS